MVSAEIKQNKNSYPNQSFFASIQRCCCFQTYSHVRHCVISFRLISHLSIVSSLIKIRAVFTKLSGIIREAITYQERSFVWPCLSESWADRGSNCVNGRTIFISLFCPNFRNNAIKLRHTFTNSFFILL